MSKGDYTVDSIIVNLKKGVLEANVDYEADEVKFVEAALKTLGFSKIKTKKSRNSFNTTASTTLP